MAPSEAFEVESGSSISALAEGSAGDASAREPVAWTPAEGSVRKYRLTLLFVATALVAIAIAAVAVNVSSATWPRRTS